MIILFMLGNLPLGSSINIKGNKIEKENINEESISLKIKEIINKINKTLIKNFLEELISIGPRMTGTYGCENAGEYIYNKFLEFSLDAEKHKWKGFGNIWHPGYYQSENIIGTLEGKNKKETETIVFNAHYDTVEDTVGANDDGSGVIGVLAAAYVLSQYNFNRTIKFVTFSGEEIGLLGSTNYVRDIYKNNEEILVEFNADMIGLAKTKDEGRKIRLSYSEDTNWIIDEMEKINKSTDKFHLQISAMYPYDRYADRGGSDYYEFIKHGYESISVWESTWDPKMHTPDDNITNVNISYLVNTTRIIASTIAKIADQTDIPPRIKIIAPKRNNIYISDKNIDLFKLQTTIVFNDIWIYTDVKKGNSPIKKVDFYYDGVHKETIENPPFVWHLNKNSVRKHKIKVVATDEIGRNSTDEIEFLYFNLLKSK